MKIKQLINAQTKWKIKMMYDDIMVNEAEVVILYVI